MYRGERLDLGRPDLRGAGDGATQMLRETALTRAPEAAEQPWLLTTQMAAHLSLMHGFAMMLIDGRWNYFLQGFPDEDEESLFEAVLQTVWDRK